MTHVPDDELRRYAAGDSTPPALWSVEAHVAACAPCRLRVAAAVPAAPVDAGWRRLSVTLDAPVPGPVERLLTACGVPEHTARLLAATPVLRASWLCAVLLTLLSTVLAAHLAEQYATPILFLTLAPLLPLAGVAASFGPGVDPTYEIALVAPVHTFRLLLMRCAAVLATTTVISAGASVAIPGYGLAVLGWFLPGLVLTLLSLALTPRLGPVVAASLVGAGWLVLLGATLDRTTGGSVLFTAGGQGASAVACTVAALALRHLRTRFDTDRRIPLSTHPRRNA